MDDFLTRKKTEVLTAIKPLCEAFNCRYDYEIDETESETLVINGTKINCTGASVEAICDEFIGYLFVKRYCRRWHLGAFHKQTINKITHCWRKD